MCIMYPPLLFAKASVYCWNVYLYYYIYVSFKNQNAALIKNECSNDLEIKV